MAKVNHNTSKNQPKWLRLLQFICPDNLYEEIEGDLIQKFNGDVKKFGMRSAKRKLAWNTIRFCRPGIVLRNKFSFDLHNISMLRNYIKVAFRHFMRRKAFSIINMLGLSIGLSVCLVILKYVDFELSFDSYHEKADRIYRTVSTYRTNHGLKGIYPLSDFGQGPGLVAHIPEVKNYVRTHLLHGGAVLTTTTNSGDRAQFYEDQSIQFVDSSFFDVFTHQAIEGDLETALDEPNSIVLTERAALKYFGKEKDIVGKVINVSGNWWVNKEYIVKAVIRNVPDNSHLTFDFLINAYHLLHNDFYKTQDGSSTEGNFATYVELVPDADVKAVISKLPDFIKKFQGAELEKLNVQASLTFQPIRDIHLSPGLDLEFSPTVSLNTIYFFILISLLIIIIAWINYINLSTSRTIERGKEVGIKKAIGARRSQLILQFTIESILLHLASAVVAISLAFFLLPVIGKILYKDLWLDVTDYKTWVIVTGFVIGGSLVASIYPSVIMSSFKPVAALKGIKGSPEKIFSLRHALIVFQFIASLVVITGTFTVTRQLLFMQQKDLGFSKDQMVVIKGPGIFADESSEKTLTSLKLELKKISSVEDVTTSEAIPGGGYNWGTGMRKIGSQEENQNGEVVFVDEDFINAFNFSLIAGSVWDDVTLSKRRTVLINEAGIRTFGYVDPESAIGEKLIIGTDTFQIQGVLKNYHWSSLKSLITPLVLVSKKACAKNISVKLNKSNIAESIGEIERQYKASFPEIPFEYFFMDDYYNQQYRDDQQFSKIFRLFGVLTIFIACLGLWGLASWATKQRTKEISIRKVLGASVSNIMTLLTAKFFKLLMAACVIAFPLSWYGVSTWLHNYAYRIDISWDLFITPIIALVVLALGTVSLQTIKAALTNPTNNLRSE